MKPSVPPNSRPVPPPTASDDTPGDAQRDPPLIPSPANEVPAQLPVLADVQAARDAIAKDIVRTQTLCSRTLSRMCGAQLWLKFENRQFTASFKERGALNKLLSLSAEQRSRGVVAASAGNHAQAVAYHAARLGIAATIVMPTTTPFIKITNTEVLGARIVQRGDTVDEAQRCAHELVEQQHLVEIPPFDDPLVIAGQGTVALELLEDVADLDVVVVPVGGGGLIAGIATVIKALRPQVRVVGVQADRFSAMADAFNRVSRIDSDPPVEAPPPKDVSGFDTLADGIAVKRPGRLTRQVISQCVDEMLTVSEEYLEQACNNLLEYEKSVAEGAGAAAVAAVFQHQQRFAAKRVACIISGGNMDPRVMADTILRGLARTWRLARLRVDVRDLPGSLADITRTIADQGANIVEVVHERVFLASPNRVTRLSIEIATRHRKHAEAVADALRDGGHDVKLL